MRFNTNGFTPSDDEQSTPKRVAIPFDSKEFIQSLQDFEEKVEQLRKEFQELFQSRVKVVFDAVPDLESIQIIQYTPYFMDGDACEFSIHSVSFYNEEEPDTDWDYDFESPSEQQVLKDALQGFIYSNQDLMCEMYGDHAEITITRDGTDISEHEHD